MPRPIPVPRSHHGKALMKGDTWLEPEEYTYPSGAQIRRARCLMPDGTLRVVRCGTPDTYFSIPAHVTIKGLYFPGYVMVNDADVLEFYPLMEKVKA